MYQPAFTNHRIIGGVAALATFALLPFTILHVAHAAWYEALVNGSLNVLLAVGTVLVFLFRRNLTLVQWIGLGMVGLANLAAILMISAQGAQSAYWIFPIMFANFYLLPFASGTVLSIVFATVSLGLLSTTSSIPAEYFLRLLITTPLCIFFGVVYSRGMTEQRRQLQYFASHDALTGLGNRHSMERDLRDAVARKERYDERCSLVILDLDHFKAINDSLGHLRADAIIVELAELLSERVRIVDRLYRFGGEEFVLLLPHAGARACWQLAEALRLEVEENQFGADLPITISAGTAEIASGETAEEWLQRADAALYRAKEAGRNRVIPARERGEPTAEATGFPVSPEPVHVMQRDSHRFTAEARVS